MPSMVIRFIHFSYLKQTSHQMYPDRTVPFYVPMRLFSASGTEQV